MRKFPPPPSSPAAVPAPLSSPVLRRCPRELSPSPVTKHAIVVVFPCSPERLARRPRPVTQHPTGAEDPADYVDDQDQGLGEGVHGVCYGMVGDNLPSRADVVQLFKSHNIHAMRLYYPDLDALTALRGSGIGLILDVGGDDVVANLAGSASAASAWVQANVQAYYPDVLIRYIAVGNEVQGDAAQGSILPAMRNVRAALAAAGLSSAVKVSTSIRMDAVTDSFPPSSGCFALPYMADVARFLSNTGAPLLANVYPYFAYRDNPRDISLGYATFRPGTTVEDYGNGLVYTNLFDAMVDAIHAALEKAGAANVRVVVSESGWPSAGGFAASVDNARTFNQALIDHVRQGTPRRPGTLETYVFAMFNENQKPGDPTEKYFGLFHPDKTPVYPITFPN